MDRLIREFYKKYGLKKRVVILERIYNLLQELNLDYSELNFNRGIEKGVVVITAFMIDGAVNTLVICRRNYCYYSGEEGAVQLALRETGYTKNLLEIDSLKALYERNGVCFKKVL